jgi:glycerol-3-phosphate acyltransferase PlsY
VTLFLLFLGSYLLGGVPVGVLVAKAHGIDIFEVGSGNIGVTNVGRVLGWKAWPLVFVPDVLKGAIPAWVAPVLIHGPVADLDVQTIAFMAGLCAVLGHCVSPFLRFRGGKGVATALGAGIGAAPAAALSSFALFGVVLAATRYMAIASVVGVSAPMLFGAIFPHQSLQLEPFYALLSASVFYRHRKNFRRLKEGTEPKFSFRKSKPAQSANQDASSERLEAEGKTPNSGEPRFVPDSNTSRASSDPR